MNVNYSYLVMHTYRLFVVQAAIKKEIKFIKDYDECTRVSRKANNLLPGVCR